MATYVGQIPNSREFSETIEDDAIVRTRSIEFIMQAADGENERNILQSPGVPARLDPWTWDGEVDIMSRCRRVTAHEINAVKNYWRLRAEYSSKMPDQDEQHLDPVDRTPRWSWSSRTIEHSPTKDAAGTLIAASNGQPFFITVPVTIPILTIKRYRNSFSGQDILDYTNTVNNTAFWGAAQDEALMSNITAEQVDVEGKRLWQVTYTIDFKIGDFAPKGWQLELLDQGTYYISGGNKYSFTDEQGNPISGNLDGSTGNKSATAQYIEFQIYERTEFNDLDLGPW